MARTERELTDAQWAKLAPLLPPQRPRMGWPPKDHPADRGSDRVAGPHRRALAGPARRVRPWATVASRFYRWRRQGVWDRVLQALQADADARGELDWLLQFVDGSVVRAHQHAAGARRRPAADLAVARRGGAPADPDQQGDREREREALGRSRAATPPSCTFGSKAVASRW